MKSTMVRSATLAAVLLAVPAAAARLPQSVVPARQSVELRVDPARDAYSGTVVVDLEVKEPATQVVLHAQEIAVDAAEVDGTKAAVTAGEDDTLVVTPARPLAPGRARLTIAFHNEFDRRAVGLYKMERLGTPYVFTQFQPADARKAFPCFDEPGFKIPWQVTVHAPAALTAVSNTPGTTTTQDGWTRTTFAATKPLPSYLLAIAVGDFAYVPVDGLGVPGRIVTVKGQEHLTALAARITPPLLRALEAYFATPYPYEKLDLIAVPEYWPGAMEHPGAITFAEGVLLVDEARATPAQLRTQARLTAHELAHMWFGDLVTMAWWDDLWLNETFADWLGDRVADQVFPGLGVALAEMQPAQATMNGDARATAFPIRRRVDDAHAALNGVGLAYNKGRTVLDMVERFLGPERFRDGVRAYMAKHAWGSAVSADFAAALDAATGLPASRALASFIDQPGIPRISVEPLGGGRLRLTQQRHALAGASVPPATWRVPVALRYSDGRSVAVKTVLLEDRTQVVDLGVTPVAWLLPQADGAGYYRWELPAADMERLLGVVPQLSARERMAVVGNAGALLDAGRLTGERYLATLARFASDPEPEVVGLAVAGVLKVEPAFATDATRPAFSGWIRRTFTPALDRLGFEPRPGEHASATVLRPALLALLGDTAEDPAVLAWARVAGDRALADPAAVHPSVLGAALTLRAATGEAALFEEYRKRFETATVPADRARFLAALGGFRDPALRARVLEYAISGPLRPNELLTSAGSLGDTPQGRAQVFTWITTNYATIAKRLPPLFLPALPFVAGGCEEERVGAARAFFGDPSRAQPATPRQLDRLAEQVGQCVDLRRRELPAVTRYLAAR